MSKVIKGENDLLTLRPDLVAEWSFEKNADLKPDEVAFGGDKKIWWICKNGHEWQATLSNRKKGKGCPYCSGRYVLTGENDLLTIRPDLAAEWNYKKNGDLVPETVMPGSDKKVWWICKNGHEWQTSISSRNRGNGCPYCSGRKIKVGENDLATLRPDLVLEWNYDKNGELKPEDVRPGSGKNVWWKCENGHEWQAKINNRNKGNACPFCANRRVLKGYNDLATRNYDISLEWNYEKNGDLKPDGVTCGDKTKVWWKCKKGHEWQSSISARSKGSGCPYCAGQLAINGENDLATLRPDLVLEWNYEKNGDLKPENVMSGSGRKVWWKGKCGHEWQSSIGNRSKGSGCPYCTSRKVLNSFNSLAIKRPDLATEWNYEKNGDFTPEDYSLSSHKRVWWKCNEGHEWNTAIYNRTKGNNCPYCSGRLAIKGKNDLATTRPDLALEWNYNKNGELKPDGVLPNSNRKVWWKCKNDHEWKASIYSRSRNDGNGCPYCGGLLAITGVNDLVTLRPDLALEWNYEKNGSLKPENVKPGSSKKVWWKGKCGHEWKAVIYSRNDGNGCPFCAGHQVLKGFNDLTTRNPKLALEWNYEKNTNLKPEDVTSNSNKIVWWICKEGHEWKTSINNRNGKGFGCPYCWGRYAIKGETDLATLRPDLTLEWNYEKNGELKPDNVTCGSIKKVWWKCDKGHEWRACINDRNGRDNGCPYCSGRSVIIGENDLATLRPDLASEWNYKKNGVLKPENVKTGSSKRVWWICKEGHEWQSTIANRNAGYGCPVCNQSHLEKATRKYLEKNEYEFEEQVKFEDLRSKNPLSYDFGLCDNGVLYALIECQGAQHYGPVEYFGGEKQYQKQLKHDELKRQYCKKNNILLIEIPFYYSDEDIERALKKDRILEMKALIEPHIS